MDFFGKHPSTTLLLINPDNPTGNFIPRADVVRLAQWCQEKGIRLVVDESFVDFSLASENNSLLTTTSSRRYPADGGHEEHLQELWRARHPPRHPLLSRHSRSSPG